MPTDMSGRHHMNPQIARMHDQQKPANLAKPMEGDPETAHVIELHKHPDGHFSTLDQKDGEQMDHESSEAAHAHMQMKHDDMDDDFDNDHNEQVDAGRKVKMADSGGY